MGTKAIKSGFVSIIGLPNAGKSTFLNAVLNDKLAITSNKPQTTRKNLKGIYNDEDSQIVFVDTPGIHNAKNKLDEYMSASIKKSLDDIDALIVIIDVQTIEKDDYTKIFDIVKKCECKKILLVNKCDVDNKYNDVTNEKIFTDMRYEKVFYISALKNKYIIDVIDYIKTILPNGDRYYDDEDLTDEPMKQIIADMIRQQCLYKLNKEIPHGITIIIESMKESKSKCMNIDAVIVCEKENHKGIIIGNKGSMIKNIGTGARISIEKFMNKKVNLKLQVIVKNNWRDEKTLVANYGYDIKNI